MGSNGPKPCGFTRSPYADGVGSGGWDGDDASSFAEPVRPVNDRRENPLKRSKDDWEGGEGELNQGRGLRASPYEVIFLLLLLNFILALANFF